MDKISFEEKKKTLQIESRIADYVDFIGERNVKGRWYIVIKCKACGEEFVRNYFDLMKMKSCPACFKNSRLSSEINFLRLFKKNKNWKDIELKSSFVNSVTPISCKCKVCGYEWHSMPNNLLVHGCIKCASKKKGVNNIIPFSVYEKELKTKFPNIICTKYVSNKSPENTFICTKHNYVFQKSLYLVLREKNGGCDYCHSENESIKKASSAEEFSAKLNKLSKTLILNSDYKNSKSKVQIKCTDCGMINYVIPNQILSRPKCIYCSDGLSFPNKFIRGFFKQIKTDYIEFEYSPKWVKGRSYDVYFELGNEKFIVEMDGKQHYEGWRRQGAELQRSIDMLKDKLAEEHNIKMIRIDCSSQRLIPQNIKESCLSDIFDLSTIDFEECNRFAFSSLMKIICKEYDNSRSTIKELAAKYGLSSGTVKNYLRFGTDNHFCNYKKKDSLIRYRSKEVKYGN